MKRTKISRCAAILALFLVVFAASGAFATTVPQVASAMGREMDRQLARHPGQSENGMSSLSLCVTTPMDITNLEISNTLALQMQEELARWFVQAGYPVLEIRKGRNLLFEPSAGEMMLTRREKLLGTTKVTCAAIVAGTYTVSPENVRFNINIVRAGSSEVLAMSTLTVPMSREVAALASGGAGADAPYGGSSIAPTVMTLLP